MGCKVAGAGVVERAADEAIQGRGRQVITDEQVEAAVDYLRDSADSCAKKRAERLYLDEYTRALKSLIMSEHLAETLGAQERYAYSDIRYQNHLAALKISIWED